MYLFMNITKISSIIFNYFFVKNILTQDSYDKSTLMDYTKTQAKSYNLFYKQNH